jgi:predicted LPLAT superfamily acyltransferase
VSESAKPRWEGTQRGGRLGNLFIVMMVRTRFGRAVAPFFLFWTALYFLVAAPKARSASFDLARRVGRGDTLASRLRFAFMHFSTYGATLFDRMAMLSSTEDLFRFDKHGEEAIAAALESGRGAVLLASHFGNWELMAQCLTGLSAPTTMVMYDGVQPQVKEALSKLAEKRSFEVLFTDGGPVSAAGILSALNRGHLVGMMADRTLAGRSVGARFLGDVAQFPVGPYSIAAAARVPTFQVFAVRRGRGRYSFHGFPMGVLQYRDRRRKNDDFERWAGVFAQRLEEFTREHPEQWGNFFDFWMEGP